MRASHYRQTLEIIYETLKAIQDKPFKLSKTRIAQLVNLNGSKESINSFMNFLISIDAVEKKEIEETKRYKLKTNGYKIIKDYEENIKWLMDDIKKWERIDE